MPFRPDVEKHQKLIEELVDIFRQQDYKLIGADGITGVPRVKKLHNDGYGDQENKSPDVYAYDEQRKRFIIGEAKTGDGDFETEHSLTEYNVFLDQFDTATGLQALLYVIVPSSKVPEFNMLITHYIHRDYWQSIVLVSSKKFVG
ncbi:MAG: hypothetical protein HY088_06855 [Ignavibacteriales bacterium]|nr:hypothetical protein [Ignavibacteriales bacterium]